MSESMMTTNSLGNKFWRNSKGEYHRTDGPAIEWSDGDKEWYANGERHRLNGPAVEYQNGDTIWYVNGKWLGLNVKGFWNLWDKLTPEQKEDPVLLTYLPGDFKCLTL